MQELKLFSAFYWLHDMVYDLLVYPRIYRKAVANGEF
jgi:hypothetical protein